MDQMDEPRVRAAYRLAHPRWPERSRRWYFVHPTLVVDHPDAGVIGFTSISVGPDELGLVLYGVDLCVVPKWRGRGYGRELADERLLYGADVGCNRFLGATQPDNRAMRAILEAQGFSELPLRVVNAFPNDQAAVMYGGPLAR